MMRKANKKTTILLVIGIVLFSTSVLAFSIMDATSSFFTNIFNPQKDFASITGFATLGEGGCTAVPVGECAGANQACVAKISSSTNAHLGTPDDSTYNMCICCAGTDLTGDCETETHAVFASLLANDNSHGAVPGTDGYDVDLCLGVTTGTVTCHGFDDTDFQVGACDSGTCVLKLAGLDNAHAEACDQTNYDVYLCCVVTEGEEEGVMCWVGEEEMLGIVTGDEPPVCTEEGLPCCNLPADAQDGRQTHCSFGHFNNYQTGHCCPPDTYYYQPTGQCLETTTCGFGQDFDCPYDPENPEEYLFWLAEPACVDDEESVSCCPNVDWHGEPGNYLAPIHVYDGIAE